MKNAAAIKLIDDMRSQLAMFDYLLPGDWLPEPPMEKRWFRWRPAFAVTQGMVVWAGGIARARVLMDLDELRKQLAGEES